ncbi:hypothetical protein GCM10009663_39280 [Kitasatospora arboriphila]|uniref:Uncharacterized protein n=1 Tax=Kitasatospora arboriphila TaxID=258052 RepID=A0ABN1TLZ2_9ACTN
MASRILPRRRARRRYLRVRDEAGVAAGIDKPRTLPSAYAAHRIRPAPFTASNVHAGREQGQ